MSKVITSYLCCRDFLSLVASAMYALLVFSLGVMIYATDILVVKDARFNLTAVR